MQAGNPDNLGAHVVDKGVNFALYSAVAERVELCLFDDEGRLRRQLDLPDCRDRVWHGYLEGVTEGQRYGYRVHGPTDGGSYSNPAKLLIDPYARELDGELQWHAAVFGHNSEDSAPFVPKSVVRRPPSPAGDAQPVPWPDAVFYEANVRGYTMRHPAVPEAERGRFVGMRNRDVLAYLKALGVTSVELMPVHAFADEHHLAKKGLRNFWGYNSINFFAPASRYALEDPVTEFRDMVNAIHDCGLEVILDVVYNHTAESGRDGPTLSFRGIDNRSYYRLDAAGEYVNDTGCGNTLDADSEVVQRLVLDSLRYWTTFMGVDGFRFDLATILGRHPGGFSPRHPLLLAIAGDPVLSSRKLVAEPWDPGPGGYQLGNFLPPWAELNDRFRDTARRFWRGDSDTTGEMASRLSGSADIFAASGRDPHASINKITSHDGFTLADVVSYERRHNEANGEHNRDGHSHNLSVNHGVEGPTGDASILAARRQHRLNLLATLLISRGTPFLLAGDEFGNSQMGNNNAYAQDNEIGWLDWQGLERDPEFLGAVRTLIGLRKEFDLLRRDLWPRTDGDEPGERAVLRWFNPDGSDRNVGDWGFGHAFGLLREGDTETGTRPVAIVCNAWSEGLEFRLPVLHAGRRWRVEFSSVAGNLASDGESLTLPGRSMALLAPAVYNQ